MSFKKVRQWTGYALLIAAVLAGLVLLLEAFERGAAKSVGVKATGWEIVTIEDADYVAADSISNFYHFESSRLEGSNFFLRSNNLILMAKIGSREILINNIKIKLDEKVIQSGAGVLFSRIDLVKLIDPVLRPTEIKFAGTFDAVIIDAGHGGSDSGTAGVSGNEKEFTLQLALALERKLIQRGFKVIMTRRTDASLLESQCVQVSKKDK